MVNIFWNKEERRLRAFWRLLLQTVLLLLFTVAVSWLAIAAGILWLGLDPTLFTGAEGSMAIELIAERDLTFTSLITTASLFGIVISVWLAGKWFDRRKFIDFGFHFDRRWWEDFIFGLALGAFMIFLIFLTEWTLGWVEIKGFFVSLHAPFWVAIGIGLFNYICVGIREELLSRGYHFTNIAEGLGFIKGNRKIAWLLAYLLSSMIFGLLHLGNPNASITSTLNLVMAGLLLGLGYYLTRELAIPIGVHITWNFFQGKVFGFPVSGLNTSASIVYIEQKGPQIWTGGAFGPEAGLLGLLAILLGCGLTVLWVRKRRMSEE